MRYADSDEVLREVGRHVRELRQAKGMTQVTVARELKVATQRVQFIEAGRANLTLETLIGLANTLDAPLTAFFEPAPAAHHAVNEGKVSRAHRKATRPARKRTTRRRT